MLRGFVQYYHSHDSVLFIRNDILYQVIVTVLWEGRSIQFQYQNDNGAIPNLKKPLILIITAVVIVLASEQ